MFPRHRSIEFLKFLQTRSRQTPANPPGYGQLRHPQHPNVRPGWPTSAVRPALHSDRQQLAEHGRVFFSQLTDKAIRRGIFHSVPDLIDAIQAYLAAHNQNPEPFQWTATTDQILDKVRRGRVTLETIAN